MILRLFNKKEIEISDASTNLIIVMEGRDAALILDAVKELTDANLVQYYLVTAQAEIPCERGHVISTSIEYTGEAKAGETLRLSCAATDTAFAMQGETEKRLFRMLLEYGAAAK